MGLFKKVFGKKGFFDRIGRGIDKATGGLGSKVLKVAKSAIPAVAGVALAPITGGLSLGTLLPVASKALKAIGDSKVGKIVDAAVRDGVVKVDKIDQTLKKVGVNVGKDVVNHIGNSVSAAVSQETGIKVPVMASTSSVPSRDVLDPSGDYKSNWMSKIKAKAMQVWDFAKKNKVAFGIGVLVIGAGYVVYRVFGGKKWRV